MKVNILEKIKQVLNNDYHPNGTQLDIANLVIVNPTNVATAVAVNSSNGTIQYQSSSTLGLDSFSYRICDVAGLCDTATVYVYVYQANDLFNNLVVTAPSSCNTNDGSIQISTLPYFDYSIDDGQTWQNSPLFTNIDINAYYLKVKEIIKFCN